MTGTLHPNSIEELCAQLASMGTERRRFLGGTSQVEGTAVDGWERAQLIDLSRLEGVIEHRAEDLVVRVRAGTPIESLQGELARRGQRWPVAIATSDRSTVGGLLATDARSARSLRYGRARDWVLGSTMVCPDGRAVRAGGSVVKNVSGYDLTKLYIGSCGTLGALAEVSLKLDPVPPSARALSIALDDASRSLRELHRPGTTLSAMLERRDRMHLLFEGSKAAVDRDVNAAASTFPQALIEETTERFERRGQAFEPAWLRLRIELPLRAEPTLLPSLRASLTPPILEAHRGCGVAWLVWPEPGSASARQLLTQATQAATPHGAWVAVEMSAEPLEAIPGPHSPALLEMNDRIKRAFDPDAVLPPSPLRASARRPRAQA